MSRINQFKLVSICKHLHKQTLYACSGSMMLDNILKKNKQKKVFKEKGRFEDLTTKRCTILFYGPCDHVYRITKKRTPLNEIYQTSLTRKIVGKKKKAFCSLIFNLEIPISCRSQATGQLAILLGFSSFNPCNLNERG